MDEDQQLLRPPAAAEAPPPHAPIRVQLLFLFIALATVSPAAASMALVDEITTRYDSAAYEKVVGLLVVSALPVAAAQAYSDQSFDARFGLRDAAAARLAAACAALVAGRVFSSRRPSRNFQVAACAALTQHGRAMLYGCTFVVGVATWVANGVLNALAVAVVSGCAATNSGPRVPRCPRDARETYFRD